MLREILLKKRLKAHLLAINEPFKPRGGMGPAAGAIQREHVTARVHLLLPGYRRPLLR